MAQKKLSSWRRSENARLRLKNHHDAAEMMMMRLTSRQRGVWSENVLVSNPAQCLGLKWNVNSTDRWRRLSNEIEIGLCESRAWGRRAREIALWIVFDEMKTCRQLQANFNFQFYTFCNTFRILHHLLALALHSRCGVRRIIFEDRLKVWGGKVGKEVELDPLDGASIN